MRVQVKFPESARHYTYEWPDKLGPVEVGEWVVTPNNHWKPESVAIVTALTSDYAGPVATLVGWYQEEY